MQLHSYDPHTIHNACELQSVVKGITDLKVSNYIQSTMPGELQSLVKRISDFIYFLFIYLYNVD